MNLRYFKAWASASTYSMAVMMGYPFIAGDFKVIDHRGVPLLMNRFVKNRGGEASSLFVGYHKGNFIVEEVI